MVDPSSGEAEAATEAKETDDRAKAFTDYKKYLGKDITSLVILPVWIMQPFSMLQNMTEIMEYTDQLDKAAKTEDPYERLAWVCGFTMGPFGAIERPWKPFNPILGETFEYCKPCSLGGSPIKYLAEQVSHHPPVGAGHGECDLWTYDLVSAPKTKFLGNAVEVYPIGRSRITLKTTGEVFSLVPPTSKANNVIIGRTWIDTYGDYTLVNHTSGARVHMYYQQCGWFGQGRYIISGTVKKEDGTPVYALEGKWNEYLNAQKCDVDGDPLPDAPVLELWRCKAKPENDPYAFTFFAHELNSCKGVNPLPSDSRRRPDRAALELGDSSAAAVAKYNLEEMQRTERRERESRAVKEGEGYEWNPRFFKSLSADAEVFDGEYSNDECPQWQYNGEYMKLSDRPPCDEKEVQGKGFCPWQFPEMHSMLGKELQRT